MYNIAICDDDKEYMNIMKEYVDAFYREKAIENRTLCFDSPEKFWQDCEKYNLILLDIDMPSYDGIEVGKQIRSKNPKIEIIYVTNYLDYHAYAFQAHAFDYIIKPVNKKKLFLILNELNMHNNIGQKIAVKTRTGIRQFDLDEICYVESIRHELKIICNNKKEYIIQSSMKEIFSKLQEFGFDFSHKGFIVNLKKIKSIKGFEIVLENNLCVPLAQKRAMIFKKNFMEYLQKYI
ncbi:LytR/AlgR family response regulator transcription factor [Clostridium botulinum]|uniref:LytR/AlgR family response regulator transcription factor n=1 Tax=Clostridium botulinum TaxID=1491 RepID=UPI002490DA8E|nr:LytTR family DNA-binding domain-containing protein [Clostridium botulinum]BDB03001.1 DNA-binding response regulator [Clostridium botulinum]